MVTVACVLKSGGIYDESWVIRLKRMVANNFARPHSFVCLTDEPQKIETAGIVSLPLKHNLPGWWSKIELFDAFRIGPVIYIDLDSIVSGDLSPLVTHSGFRSVKMWGGHTGKICSTVMSWSGDYSYIADAFLKDPRGIAKEYDRRGRYDRRIGDQAFIEDELEKAGEEILFYEEIAVRSYKYHLWNGAKLPQKDTAVVAFHGRPKPDAVNHRWVREAWQ